MSSNARRNGLPWWVFEPLGLSATAVATKLPPDEQAATEAIFGETRGLYPQPINPNGPIHDPRNWERRSHRQLIGARRALGAISERNRRISRYDGSESRNPLEAVQWNEAVSAARHRHSTDIPPQAAWFNIRNVEVTPRPPRAFPGGGDPVYWRSYGPFLNVGGGDVRAGTNVVIDIYTLPEDRPDRR